MMQEKIQRAIDLLRMYEQSALNADMFDKSGYFLAFSGGKDSVVIKELAKMAGVRFASNYSVTTIDPPELVKFIKDHHKDTCFNTPKRSFFRAFVESHGCPTRRVRWCCAEFKEQYGVGKVKILGVRKAESSRRKKTWKEVTLWNGDGPKGGFILAPIVDWTDDDVWEFIRELKLPYCSLYDEGITRIGCIGCPMAGSKRIEEFKRWPKFRQAWIRAFCLYFDMRKGKLNRNGDPYYIERFSSGNEFFEWWLSDNPSPKQCDSEACLGMYDGGYDADQSLMKFELETE